MSMLGFRKQRQNLCRIMVIVLPIQTQWTMFMTRYLEEEKIDSASKLLSAAA